MRTANSSLLTCLSVSFIILKFSILSCSAEKLEGSVSSQNSSEQAALATGAAAVQSNLQANSGHSSTLLQAEVAHSASLEPSPEPLRTGLVLNTSNIPAIDSSGSWFLIPTWMAGVWRRAVPTDGQSERVAVHAVAPEEDQCYGYQTDKHGGIWHCEFSPITQRQPMPGCVYYSSLCLQKTGMVKSDLFAIRHNSISAFAYGPESIIRKVDQAETITRFHLEAAGHLQIDNSVQFYDQLGHPTFGTKGADFLSLFKPYQRVDSLRGKDLRQDFKSYLAAHGMQNLIPDK